MTLRNMLIKFYHFMKLHSTSKNTEITSPPLYISYNVRLKRSEELLPLIFFKVSIKKS